jgi:hypothetical protein
MSPPRPAIAGGRASYPPSLRHHSWPPDKLSIPPCPPHLPTSLTCLRCGNIQPEPPLPLAVADATVASRAKLHGRHPISSSMPSPSQSGTAAPPPPTTAIDAPFPRHLSPLQTAAAGAAHAPPPVAVVSEPQSLSRSSTTTDRGAQARARTRDPVLAAVGFPLAGTGAAGEAPPPPLFFPSGLSPPHMTAPRVTQLSRRPGAPSVFRVRIGFPVFEFQFHVTL